MNNKDYTPTTDEVRLAWWMHVDNPADNEGASDLAFARWLPDAAGALALETALAERDRYRAAIVEALAFEAILPAIATAPRRILSAALEGGHHAE